MGYSILQYLRVFAIIITFPISIPYLHYCVWKNQGSYATNEFVELSADCPLESHTDDYVSQSSFHIARYQTQHSINEYDSESRKEISDSHDIVAYKTQSSTPKRDEYIISYSEDINHSDTDSTNEIIDEVEYCPPTQSMHTIERQYCYSYDNGSDNGSDSDDIGYGGGYGGGCGGGYGSSYRDSDPGGIIGGETELRDSPDLLGSLFLQDETSNNPVNPPKPSSKINVGCTLPNIIPNKWNKFNTMVYTEHTKSKIRGNYVGTKANQDIAPESCIAIIPESDTAEFKPKCKRDILWIDDYISEVFHIKLHNNQTSADIKVSFYLEDVAIPFGEISLVVSQNSSEQTSSLLGIYLLYNEKDEFVAQNIKNVLKLVNNIVDNPDSAERVQLLYSNNTDPNTINKAIQYQDKLAVSYWDNADLSIWEERSIHTSYYSNNINKMFQEIKQGQIVSNQLLKQCINMLAANFEAICNSANDSCPHLFHIWPAKKPSGWNRLNPKNWFLYKYKLHLICEGAYQYTGNVDDGQHYVFQEHIGYEVNVPKNWFIKWKRILTITAKIIFISTKIALTASGVGSLSSMIPDTLSLETINQSLPLLNLVSQDITGKTLGEVVSEKAEDMLNDFNSALEEDPEMNNLVENANHAFNELESFLDGREPLPKFAGLTRHFHPSNMPNGGKATWVCQHHAKIIQSYQNNHGTRETIL